MHDAEKEMVRITHLALREVDNSKYVSSDLAVQLPKHDTDITVTFPGGQSVTLQWRVEGPSLDICLEQDETVICWKGDAMEPAPVDPHHRTSVQGPSGKAQHVRKAAQLCLPLPADYLG